MRQALAALLGYERDTLLIREEINLNGKLAKSSRQEWDGLCALVKTGNLKKLR